MWENWSEWTQCSATCEIGIRERSRQKLKLEAGGGICSGQASESESCKLEKIGKCVGKIICTLDI